jgi:D-alanyl-D-alanine dipeptidase
MSFKIKNRILVSLVLLRALTISQAAKAASIPRTVASTANLSEFTNVSTIPGVRVDLRYAGANNFVGREVYGNFRQALLHKVAYTKLKAAEESLQKQHPNLTLLVLDALRPLHVQRVLYADVKGTSREAYVANPAKGSVHNFGFAVDLTVCDLAGKELDMGTGFDDFSPLAQPRLEKQFEKSGQLSVQQIANRHLLRDVMLQAGFFPLPIEWWHFDAIPRKELSNFQRVE